MGLLLVAALLKSFDVAKQIERLELPEVRALGPPKHRQQVIVLIVVIPRLLLYGTLVEMSHFLHAWVWLAEQFGAEERRAGVRGKSKSGEWTGELAGQLCTQISLPANSFNFGRSVSSF